MGTGQLSFERVPTFARYPPLISPETVVIWTHLTPKKVRFGVVGASKTFTSNSTVSALRRNVFGCQGNQMLGPKFVWNFCWYEEEKR
ncbi:unnamed protein product [Protopolystoma xenopodis]|uniref:Uncharacterized protein n=1 Tax=Protopolystoma xenopodis TaxID=117903 RepID=A0A3S5CE07_9PLAT|nr:unnamed protein product [Protopolystoma xenopodis]